MIAVIGAGISGLSCAWWLKEAGLDVEVFEAEPHCGGKVDTVSDVGACFETGPNTLLLNAGHREWLTKLDLTVVPANAITGNRFILRNGRYRMLPAGPVSFLFSPLFSARAKWCLLREPWRRPVAPPHETVADFFRRRLNDEWVDTLVSPFVAGIYAGNPDTLLMEECLPSMQRAEQRSGSLVGGMASALCSGALKRREACTIEGGLAALPRALSRGMNLHAAERVERLVRQSSGWGIETRHGLYRAEEVVLAVPAPEASCLLKDAFPDLAGALDAIVYAPMAVVMSLGARADMTRPIRGFGGLNPVRESPFAAGHLMAGDMFDDRCSIDDYLIASYVGGELFRDRYALSDAGLLDALNRELAALFGLTRAPRRQWLVRHEAALPQATAAMPAVRRHLAALDDTGLHVCANWLGGVSVPDCLDKGRDLAARFVRRYLAL
ncbi:protoporphyrinogen oxidase [Paludibacterium paludis]|uniref:Protoporphyrinogen oxidase n=1 Tax=Paludibacterium paludis TaxID=1225769 RepID=A0A918P4F0_9NEIS|nr:protoporphyrinogen oxidase [Paludibacterium paludis]GGY21588.1 protoporphyrinogen oxidase [Paludibacterium paludis]